MKGSTIIIYFFKINYKEKRKLKIHTLIQSLNDI